MRMSLQRSASIPIGQASIKNTANIQFLMIPPKYQATSAIEAIENPKTYLENLYLDRKHLFHVHSHLVHPN